MTDLFGTYAWNATNRTESSSSSSSATLPYFEQDSLVAVTAYSALFGVSAIGNLIVFCTLVRNRKRKSRVSKILLHLNIADLIVTFVMMPLEISWHITVAWKGDDASCRVFMFLRAFGFYLSSAILVVISLDRYFAILHPMGFNSARKRVRLMLVFSWVFSVAASAPQSVIYHIEQHPEFPWFKQCVTFNFFPSPAHELSYNIFNILTVYFIPLVVIVVTYSVILCSISRRARDRTILASNVADNRQFGNNLSCKMRRARNRTLKMTIIIVLVFIVCWTPYFVISAWWWFDEKSADHVDPKVQKGLFVFAVSNSSVNPIVYGMFTLNIKEIFRRKILKKREKSGHLYQSVNSGVMPDVVARYSPNNGSVTTGFRYSKKCVIKDSKPLGSVRTETLMH